MVKLSGRHVGCTLGSTPTTALYQLKNKSKMKRNIKNTLQFIVEVIYGLIIVVGGFVAIGIAAWLNG